MPERPLVLFASPATAEKEKRHGGPFKYSMPSYDRQIARISPKFAVLQRKLEQGDVTITSTANAVDPEYTLVFESIGDPSGFYKAVCKLKKDYMESQETYSSMFEDHSKYNAIMHTLAEFLYREMRHLERKEQPTED